MICLWGVLRAYVGGLIPCDHCVERCVFALNTKRFVSVYQFWSENYYIWETMMHDDDANGAKNESSQYIYCTISSNIISLIIPSFIFVL